MSHPCEGIEEPLSRVMTLLGKRWSGMVLGTLMQGPAFFGELRRAIPGLSDRVLTERLTELAAFGLVSRTVLEGPPLRVQYALTPDGMAMGPALDELAKWAATHLMKDDQRGGSVARQAANSAGSGASK